MIRGTTPTIKFRILDNIDFSTIVEATISLKQTFKHNSIEKTFSMRKGRVKLLSSKKLIYVTLTQVESLDFDDVITDIQLRVLTSDGLACATPILKDKFSNIINDAHLSVNDDSLLDDSSIDVVIDADLNISLDPVSSGGTSDYNDLINLPLINGVVLKGDKSLAELGIEQYVLPKASTVTLGGIKVDGVCTEVDENGVLHVNELYKSLEKVEEYLYNIDYDLIDYEFALKYLSEHYMPTYLGACSSVRKGNFYGRNYDWYYNDAVEFVVRTPRYKNRHASLGVAQLSSLTKDVVEDRIPLTDYKLLPFMMLDGINDCGVVCNINVVPSGDMGDTTGTIPLVHRQYSICQMMLVRFILDNFSTALSAVEYLRDYVSIYAPKKSDGSLQECHFMVADENNTFLLEFINNSLVVTEMINKPYMTNFYVNGVTYDSENNVDLTSVTPFGSGIERFNIITESYSTLENQNDFIALMKSLRFTNAYKNEQVPYWKTEFVGHYSFGDLVVTDDISKFSDVIAEVQYLFEHRDRSTSDTWQTVHTTVYDIVERKMVILVQEHNTKRFYNLIKYYSSEEIDNLLSRKVDIFQGTQNVGKYLRVNTQGNLELVNGTSDVVKWEDIEDKPFETLDNDDFEVLEEELKLDYETQDIDFNNF